MTASKTKLSHFNIKGVNFKKLFKTYRHGELFDYEIIDQVEH